MHKTTERARHLEEATSFSESAPSYYSSSCSSPSVPVVNMENVQVLTKAYIMPSTGEDVRGKSYEAILHILSSIKTVTIEELVGGLGEYLTSDNDNIRNRATLLLSELFSSAKLDLSAPSIHMFTVFFSRRLSDYPSVVPSILGLRALVQHYGAAFDVKYYDALDIFNSVAKDLDIPAQVQNIRQPAMCLLHDLMVCKTTRSALGTVPADVINSLLNCMEGEKDPRCLLQSLHNISFSIDCFSHTLRVHAAIAEKVFDCTACYFPITFTPPADDPFGVTTEALIDALESCLVGPLDRKTISSKSSSTSSSSSRNNNSSSHMSVVDSPCVHLLSFSIPFLVTQLRADEFVASRQQAVNLLLKLTNVYSHTMFGLTLSDSTTTGDTVGDGDNSDGVVSSSSSGSGGWTPASSMLDPPISAAGNSYNHIDKQQQLSAGPELSDRTRNNQLKILAETLYEIATNKEVCDSCGVYSLISSITTTICNARRNAAGNALRQKIVDEDWQSFNMSMLLSIQKDLLKNIGSTASSAALRTLLCMVQSCGFPERCAVMNLILPEMVRKTSAAGLSLRNVLKRGLEAASRGGKVLPHMSADSDALQYAPPLFDALSRIIDSAMTVSTPFATSTSSSTSSTSSSTSVENHLIPIDFSQMLELDPLAPYRYQLLTVAFDFFAPFPVVPQKEGTATAAGADDAAAVRIVHPIPLVLSSEEAVVMCSAVRLLRVLLLRSPISSIQKSFVSAGAEAAAAPTTTTTPISDENTFEPNSGTATFATISSSSSSDDNAGLVRLQNTIITLTHISLFGVDTLWNNALGPARAAALAAAAESGTIGTTSSSTAINSSSSSSEASSHRAVRESCVYLLQSLVSLCSSSSSADRDAEDDAPAPAAAPTASRVFTTYDDLVSQCVVHPLLLTMENRDFLEKLELPSEDMNDFMSSGGCYNSNRLKARVDHLFSLLSAIAQGFLFASSESSGAGGCLLLEKILLPRLGAMVQSCIKNLSIHRDRKDFQVEGLKEEGYGRYMYERVASWHCVGAAVGCVSDLMSAVPSSPSSSSSLSSGNINKKIVMKAVSLICFSSLPSSKQKYKKEEEIGTTTVPPHAAKRSKVEAAATEGLSAILLFKGSIAEGILRATFSYSGQYETSLPAEITAEKQCSELLFANLTSLVTRVVQGCSLFGTDRQTVASQDILNLAFRSLSLHSDAAATAVSGGDENIDDERMIAAAASRTFLHSVVANVLRATDSKSALFAAAHTTTTSNNNNNTSVKEECSASDSSSLIMPCYYSAMRTLSPAAATDRERATAVGSMSKWAPSIMFALVNKLAACSTLDDILVRITVLLLTNGGEEGVNARSSSEEEDVEHRMAYRARCVLLCIRAACMRPSVQPSSEGVFTQLLPQCHSTTGGGGAASSSWQEVLINSLLHVLSSVHASNSNSNSTISCASASSPTLWPVVLAKHVAMLTCSTEEALASAAGDFSGTAAATATARGASPSSAAVAPVAVSSSAAAAAVPVPVPSFAVFGCREALFWKQKVWSTLNARLLQTVGTTTTITMSTSSSSSSSGGDGGGGSSSVRFHSMDTVIDNGHLVSSIIALCSLLAGSSSSSSSNNSSPNMSEGEKEKLLQQQRAVCSAVLVQSMDALVAMTIRALDILHGLHKLLLLVDKTGNEDDDDSSSSSSIGSSAKAVAADKREWVTAIADALQSHCAFALDRLLQDNAAAFVPQLNIVLPCLIQAALQGRTARARGAAVQGLYSCVEQLPYARVHPYKKAVLQCLSSAVDDKKRVVRQLASRTRNKWLENR